MQFWDEWEVDQLRAGVKKFGVGKWAFMLNDPSLFFIPGRSSQQLKDKWRNLTNPIKYSERILKRFIFLNKDHSVKYSLNQTPHIYTNRLPRDAALKAATKDDFYLTDDFCSFVWIKEDNAEADDVHVFQICRQRVDCPKIQKFTNLKSAWIPSVIKIRTEKYIPKDDD